MKDLKGVILATLTLVFYFIAGFIYSDNALHFVYRQAATVCLFGLATYLSNKEYPITNIFCYCLLFLSCCEMIDELFRINTNIRINDWFYLGLGLAGIIWGIYKRWKQIR